MGGIRKIKKIYEVPRKRWDKRRIEEEKVFKKKYGLKNKKELRVFQTLIRRKRQNAKSLLAMPLELRVKKEKELIKSLSRHSILPDNATLDDVLSLQAEEVLEKRLQTIVWRKNLARTPLQARQFIVHGHIAVDGKKNTSPNYLVLAEEVDKIGYWRGKKMLLEPLKQPKKTELKKEFEEVAVQEMQELEKEPQEKQVEESLLQQTQEKQEKNILSE